MISKGVGRSIRPPDVLGPGNHCTLSVECVLATHAPMPSVPGVEHDPKWVEHGPSSTGYGPNSVDTKPNLADCGPTSIEIGPNSVEFA